MNEAGLISAGVAAAEVQASVQPSRPPEGVAHVRAQGHLGGGLFWGARVGVTLGATGIAFLASLVSLSAGFPGHLALGALGLVPPISLVLALGIAIGRQRPEPDIHDRYLDYILGLALLGAATAAMWFLPGSMSIFFWSWRLDLVWLPIFAAGAIALVCGSRALWRYCVPIIFLFLAWPLPSLAARIPGGLYAAAIAGLGLVLLVLFLLPRRQRITAHRAATATATPRREVGGGLIAAGLVCGAAILTTVADRQLETAAPLLEADGQPKLAAASRPATSIDGLSRTATINPPTLPSWGSPANHETYRYGSSQATLPGTGDPGEVGIVVDVLAPPDARDLALSPTRLATLQGYGLDAARMDDLGAGLAAHIERYLVPGHQSAVLVIWWDWPVRSPAGTQRERIIVQQLVPLDRQASRSDNLLRCARRLVASMIAEAPAS